MFTDNPNDVWLRAFRQPFKKCGIEYIHKDTFIEKACDWMRNNSHNYANNALGKEYLVNDFKNYMMKEK